MSRASTAKSAGKAYHAASPLMRDQFGIYLSLSASHLGDETLPCTGKAKPLKKPKAGGKELDEDDIALQK